VPARIARSASAVASALVAIALLLACTSSPARPDLILIVVDTLRADRIAGPGDAPQPTPELRALADGGLSFANATAPSSWTRPSVASLFTSRWPSEHGAVTLARPLAPSLPTLAELLRDAGYRTVGVSANFVHVSEASGLARGFTSWQSPSEVADDPERESVLHMDGVAGAAAERRALRADEVNRRVLAALPGRSVAPLFLYVHYMDPHSPYGDSDRPGGGPAHDVVSNDEVLALARRGGALPERERHRLVERYDADVRSADRAIGALLAALRERGWLERSGVVVTSDHGEAFGEHGNWFHGTDLHAESLRVPLVLVGPGVAAGRRSDAAVDLLDVPTTLLRMAGVAPPAAMRGRDLRALDGVGPRVRVAELHPDAALEARVRARLERMALSQGPWKSIWPRAGGPPLLFRTDRDPGERQPLAAEAAPARVTHDFEATRRKVEEAASAMFEGAGPQPRLDEEERRGLRALGYAE